MRNQQLLAAVLALVTPATSHSWIETAQRIAPNGTIIEGRDAAGEPIPGQIGYPRGPNRSQQGFTDATHRLPLDGTTYTEKDTLNELPPDLNPPTGLLEASPGDWLAIRHFENGHTTQVATNPNKPLNRGSLFFYGTTRPSLPEKLMDVHMKWNKDGNGGDKRGKLIATRNYDDGQCFQVGHGPIWEQRLKAVNGDAKRELACQSDIQLPLDLKEGDIYTIYWYWDWPDLNTSEIDLKTTAKGAFPWGGDEDMGKKGFKKEMIEKNESYSSTIDIKITGKYLKGGNHMMKDGSEFEDSGDVYSMAIKEQLSGNFAVDFEGGGERPLTPGEGDFKHAPEQPAAPSAPAAAPGGGGGEQPPAVPPPAEQPSALPPPPPPADQQPPAGTVTVSVTETVAPSPIIKTITVTASDVPAAPAPTKTVTTTLTVQPTTLEKVVVTSSTFTPPAPSPTVLPGQVFRKPTEEEEGEQLVDNNNNHQENSIIIPAKRRSLISSRLFGKRQSADRPPLDKNLEEQTRKLSQGWHEEEKERNKDAAAADAADKKEEEKEKKKPWSRLPFVWLGGAGRRPARA